MSLARQKLTSVARLTKCEGWRGGGSRDRGAQSSMRSFFRGLVEVRGLCPYSPKRTTLALNTATCAQARENGAEPLSELCVNILVRVAWPEAALLACLQALVEFFPSLGPSFRFVRKKKGARHIRARSRTSSMPIQSPVGNCHPESCQASPTISALRNWTGLIAYFADSGQSVPD